MGRKLADFAEDDLIARLFAPIATALDDDAALLKIPAGEDLLASSDMLCEGIHFPSGSPAALVAEKTVRANVSDIVACGGRPRWLTLGLSLPPQLEISWLEDFSAGLARAMAATGTSLVGGDTTASAGAIHIAMTALGTVAPACRIGRGGARAGDLVVVTGTLGDAAIGLEVMLGSRTAAAADVTGWTERHFLTAFRGDFAQAAAAARLISAMMDLSDGLICDLERLCRTSGVGVEIEISRLPLSRDAEELGLCAEDALSGGEDYELLCCVPPVNWPTLAALAARTATPATVIGSIQAAPNIVYRQQGKPRKDLSRGWQHFK